MPRKRFTVEQIINHLREADVLLAQGRTVGEVCRRIGVSEQSYYRWRKEYGGLKVGQARRLKDLEAENARPDVIRVGAGMLAEGDELLTFTQDLNTTLIAIDLELRRCGLSQLLRTPIGQQKPGWSADAARSVT